MKSLSDRRHAWWPAALLLPLPALGTPADTPETSPVRQIVRGARPDARETTPDGYRRIDGRDNNAAQPAMGAAGTALLRWSPADYADGMAQMVASGLSNPRDVSNAISDQRLNHVNAAAASSFLWQWGQFVDHDLDLTDGVVPPEAADIPVPAGDLWFDPDGTGTQVMTFNRSIYDPATGTAPGNPRQQLNEITAWIDASNVYGSDPDRGAALRTLDGTGRLRVSDGDLLPYNLDGLPNAGGPGAHLFLAGDVRANEQVGLTAMHTLFVREHNRLAAAIADAHPDYDGETIYLEARRLVGALMQAITYEEFLPLLLGPDALPPYAGYRPDVDAGIANEFATAAYRLGHSMLSPVLLRVDASGQPIDEGHLALRDAFFAPERLSDEGGIDPVLRGLAAQFAQQIDPRVIDDVRNFLFGPPGAGGFDLASLNVQRGRDHGLAGYNATRIALGLAPAADFAAVCSDTDTQARLASAYSGPDDIDLWVGLLAEDHLPGAMVGELAAHVIARQFANLRDGDRFWYELDLTPEELAEVRATRLADVIRRNTTIGAEIPDDVFRVHDLPDTDADGVADAWDNCTLVGNPAQRDADADGYGNACDTDLDNDGRTNFVDLGLLKAVFLTTDAGADFNGDGMVNVIDLGILRRQMFRPPGPSGHHF